MKRTGYIELYKGRGAKPYRFRVVAGNGEIIGQGQGYTRKRDSRRGAQRAHPGVPVKP